jgi:hypothetical protein
MHGVHAWAFLAGGPAAYGRTYDRFDPIMTGGALSNLHAKLGFLKPYSQPIKGLGRRQFL